MPKNPIIIQLSTKKSSNQRGFTAVFYKTFLKIDIILHKLFQKIEEREIFRSSFHETKTWFQNWTMASEESYKSISFMSTNAKILNRILATEFSNM